MSTVPVLYLFNNSKMKATLSRNRPSIMGIKKNKPYKNPDYRLRTNNTCVCCKNKGDMFEVHNDGSIKLCTTNGEQLTYFKSRLIDDKYFTFCEECENKVFINEDNINKSLILPKYINNTPTKSCIEKTRADKVERIKHNAKRGKRIRQNKQKRTYIQYLSISLEQGLKLISSTKKHAKIGDYIVNCDSVRLHTFASKGVNCICCGAKGHHFSLETAIEGQRPHINLYAINNNGETVLMTRDHIVLASKGGEDTVDNMSPMCYNCNQKRGNKYESQEEFLQRYANIQE